MKTARLAVGAIAIAAGGGALMMFGRSPPPLPQIVQAAPTIETDEVLVAARDITLGAVLTADDFAFQAWPRASVTPPLVRKSDGPAVLEELKGSVVRSNFLVGEPIRRDKLVKGPNAGFLSAILPSGHRAVAINIDSRGSTSAGGFILPNDHVDIINTYRDGDATKNNGVDVYSSQVILANVRVLAIGPNVQEKNGEKVVIGETATLELDPKQSEIVILAQRTGQLSLALRSMMDANQTAQPNTGGPDDDKAITVVRYGVAIQNAKK